MFETFLVGDSETLLFVDDDQSEVFEPHVFREDPVRADDHVNLA